ncbi:hypothetical protein MRX96_001216 [Rhipicephalus microplus]
MLLRGATLPRPEPSQRSVQPLRTSRWSRYTIYSLLCFFLMWQLVIRTAAHYVARGTLDSKAYAAAALLYLAQGSVCFVTMLLFPQSLVNLDALFTSMESRFPLPDACQRRLSHIYGSLVLLQVVEAAEQNGQRAVRYFAAATSKFRATPHLRGASRKSAHDVLSQLKRDLRMVRGALTAIQDVFQAGLLLTYAFCVTRLCISLYYALTHQFHALSGYSYAYLLLLRHRALHHPFQRRRNSGGTEVQYYSYRSPGRRVEKAEKKMMREIDID